MENPLHRTEDRDWLKGTADLPFTVSPSTSYLQLHAFEVGATWIEFVAWFPEQNRHVPVKVEFRRDICSRMLGIGGESSQGIGVLRSSAWLNELNELQRKSYQKFPDNFKDLRHYYFRGHDVTVEVLAEGFLWNEIEQP